ncbi:MAG: hypothetical protein M5R36_26430 [Deltaproteobacteria bacterium]|nr:hypothetical protein [Deltaproteobacteria bacterium]
MSGRRDAVLFCNGIGNFIMATPFLRNLNDPAIFMVRGDRRFTAVESISFWPVRPLDAFRWDEFERVFMLWAFPRSRAWPLLARRFFSGARRPTLIRQPRVMDWTGGKHEPAVYLALLDGAAALPAKIKIDTSAPIDAPDGALKIGLSNGGENPAKKWPLERWRELTRNIAETRDVFFVCAGGEAERAWGEVMAATEGIRCVSHAGRLYSRKAPACSPAATW